MLYAGLSPLLILLAFTPAEIQAKVAEIAPLRAQRLYRGAPPIPASAYAQIAEGAVVTGLVDVPGHAAKKAWGVGVVDVGIDALWAALNDEQQQVGDGALSYARVLRGAPCADGREVLMVMDIPVVSDRWYINHNRYNQAVASASGGRVRELFWDLSEHPEALPIPESARPLLQDAVYVPSNTGSWWLIALDDNHTILEYSSWSDPGGNIPAGPATSFVAGTIEDSFEAVARVAKSGRSACRAQ